jgi:hypothetical protein
MLAQRVKSDCEKSGMLPLRVRSALANCCQDLALAAGMNAL